MRPASLAVASLAAVAAFAAWDAPRAADALKVAGGGRGIGETFVTAGGEQEGRVQRPPHAPDFCHTPRARGEGGVVAALLPPRGGGAAPPLGGRRGAHPGQSASG